MLRFKAESRRKKPARKAKSSSVRARNEHTASKQGVLRKNKGYRPDWDEYFMNIAKEVAQRSNCIPVKFGAIIVKNKKIISTGYVGAPRKTKDCFARGSCLRRELNIPSGHRYELCRSVHAEQNAIINAARDGQAVDGADMYLWGVRRLGREEKAVKTLPCFICKKMIINAGIKRFIGHDEKGKITPYAVESWQKRWSTHDMTEDMDLYDAKYPKK